MKYQKEKLGKIPTYYSNKKNKIHGISLTKEVKDLYLENYRTLKKEIKEDTNKWKHIPCSWIGRINIIKMSILPEAIYRFNIILIKIPMTYFTDLEQIFQKFIWNPKRPQNIEPQQYWEEEQSIRDHNCWYQTILQGHYNQKSQVLAQELTHWSVGQNREPRNKPMSLCQLIFDKGDTSIQWNKDNLFNKWCWENWTGTCKKNETRPPTYTIHQNKLTMDKRLKYKSWHHNSPRGKHRQ